jgi:CDP-glucose 4,6-dehydratase
LVRLSYEIPAETFEVNVIGTANVLDAVNLLEKPCNVILITTDKVYHNNEWIYPYRENDRLGGKDPYSASKAGAEIVFSSYYQSFYKSDLNKQITSARAGNVIGGGDWATNRIVPDAITSWASKKNVEIRSPYATRPWQHVLEPLSGYLRLGQLLNDKRDLINGESFNFGPAYNQNHTVLELLNKISENWVSNNNEITTGITTNTENAMLEANLLKLNCDKSLHKLDWEPVLNFEKTTEFTGNWYYEFYYKKLSKQSLFNFTLDQIELFEILAKEKKITWAINS